MIEWNKVIYKDCMNEENGLLTLEDKSIDLCLTDPPYNIDAKIPKGQSYNHKRDDTIILYNDQREFKEYEEWCYDWFNEIKRICNMIMFTCGKLNLQMWYKKENFHLTTWVIPNSGSRGFVSNFIKSEPILCLGNFKKNKLKLDVLEASVMSGFRISVNREEFKGIIHPHPKPYKLYFDIISQINPKSVLDPFMGSGITSMVCTKLGIPWLGYEINEVYSQDINKRLKNCKKEPKQIALF